MRSLLAAVTAVLLLVAACGGGEPAATTPARTVDSMGQQLFEERVIGSNPGCITCHSLEDAITIVGPSLAGVVSPVAGMTDREYVRESIIAPDDYVVEGFSPGQMSADWDLYLTETQIESLIDFLLGE